MMRGQLLVFEGLDFCGKTTIARAVYDRLKKQGVPVVLTREPGGTMLGDKVRSIVLEGTEITPMAETLLFAASRAEHISEVILPALKAGKVVLCDRFILSSIIYQGIMKKIGPGNVYNIFITSLHTDEKAATLLSDYLTTFVFTLPFKDAIERSKVVPINRLDVTSEPIYTMLSKALTEHSRQTFWMNHNPIDIDASLSKEAVLDAVMSEIYSALNTSAFSSAEA